jgi:hypothetical protein
MCNPYSITTEAPDGIFAFDNNSRSPPGGARDGRLCVWRRLRVNVRATVIGSDETNLPAKPSGLQFCSLFSFLREPTQFLTKAEPMPDIEYIRPKSSVCAFKSTARAARSGNSKNTIDGLCEERDRLEKELPHPSRGKVLGGRRWRVGPARRLVLAAGPSDHRC